MRFSTLEILRAARVIPVIDLPDPAAAAPLVEALLAAGARVAELTLRSERSLEGLAAFAEAARSLGSGPSGHPLAVCAGTIVTVEDAAAAVSAGATALVSPGFSPAVAAYANSEELDWIPGAVTASEVMTAFDAGFSTIKFFPAEASGGIAAVKSLLGPFASRGLTIMPTGGISAANAGDYLAVPGVIAVGGSWMVGKDTLAAGAWPVVEELMREAVSL